MFETTNQWMTLSPLFNQTNSTDDRSQGLKTVSCGLPKLIIMLATC